MRIRSETSADVHAIRALIQAAFRDAEHAGGNEAVIVDALRASGALTLSLVAAEGDGVVGHFAFSPVQAGPLLGWQGLGPLAVRPDRCRRGLGACLVAQGLERVRAQGARGCVVLGDPAYYGRFGFAHDPALTLAGAPPEFFQRLLFWGDAPVGPVVYHPAFT